MLFHITYSVNSGQRDPVQEKFKKTGALPPQGVTMKGRWHNVNGNKGYIIAETTDVDALGKWVQDWSNLLTFEVVPVLVDEQIAKIIS